ncbi:Hypothetical protein PHPALM_13984 [Phytophthora palmivora]|uniref:Uncharacterized protein n=1 Tax=Phytophthora palmivora TaxID=4796 RepID=A0A2P4XVY6_9STRA|nr:Hypothetical protein PHPALM_13984 [Phytophthora palmivora]
MVKYEPTPYKVMERLKRRFMGKIYLKYTEERTKLSQLHLHTKGKMADHLSEMRRILETISVVGQPVDEYAKPAILIGSLPREYDNIVQTFLASHTPQNPEDPPNYEQLEQALERAYDHTHEEREEARVTTTRKPPHARGGRGRGRTGRGGCFHCHEQDHQVRICPHLGKHPPSVGQSAGTSPKRTKQTGAGKSAKFCEKGNESDESAYAILPVMIMKKEIADMAHNNWYLDSGASSHITNQITNYVGFTPLSTRIRVGGNHFLSVEGIGTVKKELNTTHGRRVIMLRGVRYSTELQCSLYSVRRQLNCSVPRRDYVKVHFDKSQYADVILQSGSAKAYVDDTNLYCLELVSPRDSAWVALPIQVSSLDLWHRGLGHPGRNAFNALSSHDQWPLTHKNLRMSGTFSCETCIKGKMTRHSFKVQRPTTRE